MLKCRYTKGLSREKVSKDIVAYTSKRVHTVNKDIENVII